MRYSPTRRGALRRRRGCHRPGDPRPTQRRSRMEATTTMIDLSQIDELSRRLSSLVPPARRQPLSSEARVELRQNFKSGLQAGLGKLVLVAREGVWFQRSGVLRSRGQLDALQRSVAELEARQAGKPNDPQTR